MSDTLLYTVWTDPWSRSSCKSFYFQ